MRENVCFKTKFNSTGLDTNNKIILTEVENVINNCGQCYITDEQFGELLCMSRKSVSDRIQYLKKNNFITVKTKFVQKKRKRIIILSKYLEGGTTTYSKGGTTISVQGGNTMLKETMKKETATPTSEKQQEKREPQLVDPGEFEKFLVDNSSRMYEKFTLIFNCKDEKFLLHQDKFNDWMLEKFNKKKTQPV